MCHGLDRPTLGIGVLFTLAAVLMVASLASAQTIEAPYDSAYTFTDLGSVLGVPARYGGLTFLAGSPETLLIGGYANSSAGQLYAVAVVRDDSNHVIGFGDSARFFAEAAYNDGGVVYGPGGVLFLSRWPANELGQTKPGSSITDKIIDLDSLGVAYSNASVNFVPAGYPGAGQMKLLSWSGGQWYAAAYSPDGFGTYNIDSITYETTIGGGPRGSSMSRRVHRSSRTTIACSSRNTLPVQLRSTDWTGTATRIVLLAFPS